MNPRLALYARLIRCRSLAWECLAEAACLTATAAFAKAREADGCAAIVEARALHPSRSDG